jgi:hypothetical protein
MTHPQMSLSMQSDAGFEKHGKKTRRDVFLSDIDRAVPWASLVASIEPHYPKPRDDGAPLRYRGLVDLSHAAIGLNPAAVRRFDESRSIIVRRTTSPLTRLFGPGLAIQNSSGLLPYLL